MIIIGSEEEKLFEAIGNRNVKEVQSILINSNKNGKILRLNEQNKDGSYLLHYAISLNSIEMVKLLMEYARHHQIILRLNEKNNYGDYPLLEAIIENNMVMVKLLIDYAHQHQIILELNEKNNWGEYPLYWAISKNNIKIVKLLMEYALQHQIDLQLNEKNNWGEYPLLRAIYKNNIELIKLLIVYADHQQLILALNDKNEYGNYPLLRAIFSDNFEMVQLLIDYALRHQITLEYDKNSIENKQIIKILLQNYEKEMEYRQKNGANDFRNYSGNITVQSFTNSYYISNNPPPHSPSPIYTPTLLLTPPLISSSNPLFNYGDKEGTEEKNENDNAKGDLAVVRFNHNGTTSEELTIHKGEYLVVTNWDIGDDYAYGYKKTDPRQKGKFPSPLVRKIFDKKEMTIHYTKDTHPINGTVNANPIQRLQMNRLSMLSEISSNFSISSSPSITQSIPPPQEKSEQPQHYRPTAPLDSHRFSVLSESSSWFSITSSPSIAWSIPPQPPPQPTAPSETFIMK